VARERRGGPRGGVLSGRALSGALAIASLAAWAAVWPAGPDPPVAAVPQRLESRVAVEREQRLDPGEPSAAGLAARAFLARYGGEWEFRVDPRTGIVQFAQGSGIPLARGVQASATGAAPRGDRAVAAGLEELEPLARAFVAEQRALIGPSRGRLVLDSRASLMRYGGRLASIYYRWLVDDVPVEGATVFVRLASGRVTQFGSRFVAPVELDANARIPAAEATRRLLIRSGHGASAVLQGPAELLFQPEDDPAGGLRYRLVWKVRYRTAGAPQTWEGRVDASTGEVVGFLDANLYGRVVGGVYPRSVSRGDETRVPMARVEVQTAEGDVVTDLGGGFAYRGGPASTGLGGRWFEIRCTDCTHPEQPRAEVRLGSGRLDLGLGGADEIGNGFSTPAGRNTFYHLNRVREVALKWLPDLDWLQAPGFVANVNLDYACNAYFDGATINFFRSNDECNNTGEIADIIYHEWGHGLDAVTQHVDRSAAEGTADVVAMHLTHSARFGEGIYVDGRAFRNLDSATSELGVLTLTRVDEGACRQDNGGFSYHCVGQLYGQAAWDLARALRERLGPHTGWRQSERLLFASLPDAVSLVPDSPLSVYRAYLLADDDDGNLANGTPHAAEIHAAFAAHEIAGEPVPASPACPRPAQPVVQATALCDRVELDWTPVEGAQRYEILRAELQEDTAYVPVGQAAADDTTFTDGAVAPELDYWYVVLAVDGAGCESTVERPVPVRLPERETLSLVAAVGSDEALGNGSGFIDPGETVDLSLTLANHGAAAATAVVGTLVAETIGVAVEQGAALWPQLSAGTAAPQGDAVRFRTDPEQVACGDLLRFRLEFDAGSDCAPEPSFFELRVGAPDGAGGWVCDDELPCLEPPGFTGEGAASPGPSCGDVALSWTPAEAGCDPELSYAIYRALDPAFEPGPETRVGSTLSPRFIDVAPEPGRDFTYVVRALDGAGNESAGELRVIVRARAFDRLLLRRTFEQGPAGWSVIAPTDAVRGNWELGAPDGSNFQPGGDATANGVNCWITGLAARGPGGQDNDVDGGTTTLLSPRYSLAGAVDPVLRYMRWFTNDRGANPGDPRDRFQVHVSNDDGVTWVLADEAGAGTPLAWVEAEAALAGIVTPSGSMRFRFTAADPGDRPEDDSIVEAAIDDFRLYDRDQGCAGCPLPVPPVTAIRLARSGRDVVLDWESDPTTATRFVVYSLSGERFEVTLRVGSTTSRHFVHVGAAAASESYSYRVVAVDDCGAESVLE